MNPVEQPSTQVNSEGVLLLLQVPRTNDKKELAAEQMFASLHGLLTLPSKGRFAKPNRERISFEIAVLKKRIGFYVWVPRYLMSFVEEQIYAQYPTVHISEIEDYAFMHEKDYASVLTTELKFINNDALPIKTFQSFEVDPLAAITATLAKVGDEEEAWIQMVVRPAASNWHKRSEQYISGQKTKPLGPGSLVASFWGPPNQKPEAAKLTDYEQTRVTAAEEKSQKLAFETVLRIVYKGNITGPEARMPPPKPIATTNA